MASGARKEYASRTLQAWQIWVAAGRELVVSMANSPWDTARLSQIASQAGCLCCFQSQITGTGKGGGSFRCTPALCHQWRADIDGGGNGAAALADQIRLCRQKGRQAVSARQSAGAISPSIQAGKRAGKQAGASPKPSADHAPEANAGKRARQRDSVS